MKPENFTFYSARKRSRRERQRTHGIYPINGYHHLVCIDPAFSGCGYKRRLGRNDDNEEKENWSRDTWSVFLCRPLKGTTAQLGLGLELDTMTPPTRTLANKHALMKQIQSMASLLLIAVVRKKQTQATYSKSVSACLECLMTLI